MTIEIKPLTEKDEAVWRRLWTGYLVFYESSVEEDVYQSTFKRLLGSGEYEPRAFLAWQGNEAIGLVHYMFHRHCWRVENVCYLQDLFAAPEARGTGAGRALIEAVYAAADQAGCPMVYWNTADDNHTARQLYDRIATKTEFIKYKR